VATSLEFEGSLADCATVNAAQAKEREDGKLVQAVKLGDRSAFEALYRRYARMVHGILLSRVPHGAVEDLVQDVFLAALPQLGSLRDVSRFGGWLAAIARNRAMDFHRQSRPSAEYSEEAESASENHAASGSGGAEAMVILDAIRSLPEAYRETLILRLVEGMTGPEIAERTGLTHGSVRVNLHRGMQMLREILTEGNTAARARNAKQRAAE